MNFLIVGNGGSTNRGCEALTRTTCNLLHERFPGSTFTLASLWPDDDRQVVWDIPLEIVPGIDRSVYMPGRTPWFERQRWRLLRPSLSWRIPMQPMLDAVKACDIMLSLGGDNYSADYGYPKYHLQLIECARAYRKPIVIWAASVGPFPDTERWQSVWSYLKQVDLFTVRESLTQAYLQEHGLGHKTRLVADPAFLLAPEAVDFALPEGRVVALCATPLISRMAHEQGHDFDVSIVQFMRYVVDQLDFSILLVPHVTGGHNSNEQDHPYMHRLQMFAERGDRIVLAPDNCRAAQYKYLIAQCDFLVAGRTHATIAGYSSCVPTLALSYSQKARGLCRDLLGTTDYLVDAIRANADRLIEAFRRVVDHRDTITSKLKVSQAEMTRKARLGAEALVELIGKKAD